MDIQQKSLETKNATSDGTPPVDGRNPAPGEVGSFIPLFIRFYTSQVVSRISEPSTVPPLSHGFL